MTHPDQTTSDGEYMDVEEFRAAGFLQEVNRRLLHPCGVALSVSPPWTVDDLAALLAPAGLKFDDETLSRLYKVLAYDRWTIAGVVDFRSDPDGIYFGDLDAEDIAKARGVDAEIERHAASRRRRWGGEVIQPLPAEAAARDFDDADIYGERHR